MLTIARAAAYVNQGMWIADCPVGCGNAMKLRPNQTAFLCGVLNGGVLAAGCGAATEVAWPPDAVWLWDALLSRPNPLTRNWAPAGHRQSLATGHPNGQTVADLVAETAEHGGP